MADLLCDAELLGGAAMLGSMLRNYILADAYQRQSTQGQALVLRCREFERRYGTERRAACQEAAWLLRGQSRQDPLLRFGVAAVFFAAGDVVRALAIARDDHRPSVAVLTDVLEMSLDLAPMDPLLQAVWLRYVSGLVDLPERVALPLRMRRRDVNPAYKGLADAVRQQFGVDLTSIVHVS